MAVKFRNKSLQTFQCRWVVPEMQSHLFMVQYSLDNFTACEKNLQDPETLGSANRVGNKWIWVEQWSRARQSTDRRIRMGLFLSLSLSACLSPHLGKLPGNSHTVTLVIISKNLFTCAVLFFSPKQNQPIIKKRMPPVKRRYILFQLEHHGPGKLSINEGDIVNTIKDTVSKLHGDFGYASILLNFHSKRFDPATRTGVLVAKRGSHQFILTSLAMIRSIKDQNVTIRILKLSGTIRGCLRSLQGYHGKMITEYKKRVKLRNSQTVEQIDLGFQSIRDSLLE